MENATIGDIEGMLALFVLKSEEEEQRKSIARTKAAARAGRR